MVATTKTQPRSNSSEAVFGLGRTLIQISVVGETDVWETMLFGYSILLTTQISYVWVFFAGFVIVFSYFELSH